MRVHQRNGRAHRSVTEATPNTRAALEAEVTAGGCQLEVVKCNVGEWNECRRVLLHVGDGPRLELAVIMKGERADWRAMIEELQRSVLTVRVS